MAEFENSWSSNTSTLSPREKLIFRYSIICACVCVCVLSYVLLFETPLTTDWQALLSLEFSNQEYWSGLPFPTLVDLPNPGSNRVSCFGRQILYHCVSWQAQCHLQSIYFTS